MQSFKGAVPGAHVNIGLKIDELESSLDSLAEINP